MREDPYEKLVDDINDRSPCLFTIIKGIRVTWELVGFCNLGCKHCCVSATSQCDVKPDLERYKLAVDDMVRKNVKALYLSGGEPLLWKDFFDFCSYAKNSGIKLISLATNGTLLDKENVEKLSKCGVDKILVSLDHFIPEKHDYLRGVKGIFDATIKGIKNIKRYSQIYVRVGCVIWKENYRHLEDFVKFCISLGVDEIAFSWIMKTGRAKEHLEIFPSEILYFKIGEKLINLKKKYENDIKISFHRFSTLNKKCIDCPGGKLFYYINYRGQVGPCSWISKLFPQDFLTKGSIIETSFKELIKSNNIQNFIKEEEKRCKEYGPGCPAVCYIENGNFYSMDPLLELDSDNINA